MQKKKIQKKKKIKSKKKKIIKRKRKTSKALTPYIQMEMMDENQIINDIEGRIPNAAEKMVYSFIDKRTGKPVYGLSWYGTKVVFRDLNKKKITQISVTDKAIISQGQGYVDVMVYAYDSKTKIGAWGGSRGKDKMRLKTGEMIDDNFPSAKAVSKAQRNAVNQLFPAEKVAKMIAHWVKKGNVQQIEPPKEEPPKTQQPQSDWLGKLKIELYKLGAKSDIQASAILQKKTGLVIKDFNKITPKNAQIALLALLENSSK